MFIERRELWDAVGWLTGLVVLKNEGGGCERGETGRRKAQGRGIHINRAPFSCAGSPNVKGKWGWLKPQASGEGGTTQAILCPVALPTVPQTLLK